MKKTLQELQNCDLRGATAVKMSFGNCNKTTLDSGIGGSFVGNSASKGEGERSGHSSQWFIEERVKEKKTFKIVYPSPGSA